MDQHILDTALEVSAALVQIARAVNRENSQMVALNRVRLRESAKRTAARNRRRLIREKLRDGRLPRNRPATIAGAPGKGLR